MDNTPDSIYEQFWKPIVEKDGVVDMEQLKKELFDFHELMGNAAIVYDHVTGGAISKVNTVASVVTAMSDDHYAKISKE